MAVAKCMATGLLLCTFDAIFNTPGFDIADLGLHGEKLVETFYRYSFEDHHTFICNVASFDMFFVGSEADVQGIRPTYYKKYDGKIKNEVRVAQVLDWLALPRKKRPHLITLYFSDMDDTGHRYGPNNEEEIKKTLFDLDENLGALFNGTQATGLPINIIIVSDHGMQNLNPIKAE